MPLPKRRMEKSKTGRLPERRVEARPKSPCLPSLLEVVAKLQNLVKHLDSQGLRPRSLEAARVNNVVINYQIDPLIIFPAAQMCPFPGISHPSASGSPVVTSAAMVENLVAVEMGGMSEMVGIGTQGIPVITKTIEKPDNLMQTALHGVAISETAVHQTTGTRVVVPIYHHAQHIRSGNDHIASHGVVVGCMIAPTKALPQSPLCQQNRASLL